VKNTTSSGNWLGARGTTNFWAFKIGEAGSLAPVQELADRLVVRHPGTLIADRDREEFAKSFGRFETDVGNDCWNLECFGFVKD
jgi:hypothetical protein